VIAVRSGARLDVTPSRALLDETTSVRVRGLAAGERVTVRSSCTDERGQAWSGWATFVADGDGRVDASAQAPVAGTYDGVDGMGLVWSMALAPDRAQRSPFVVETDPVRIEFALETNGAVVSTVLVERLTLGTGVRRREVREDGVVGTLFAPAGQARAPGVVVLGGSDGGVSESMAALLASRGYTSLALAYFRFEDLPPDLMSIPLEYFERAIAWLLAHDAAADNGVAVVGRSRGAELALLLGATFPSVRAVVGYVGSGLVHRGVTPAKPHEPAWTRHGVPVEFVAGDDVALPPPQPGVPVAFRLAFEDVLRTCPSLEPSTIPVERTRGPILLFSGVDDQMWPSTYLSNIAMRRLAERDFDHSFSHQAYPGAGHVFYLPNIPATVLSDRHPVAGFDVAYGGDPCCDAVAARRAWGWMLRVLDETFSTCRKGDVSASSNGHSPAVRLR
jgi:dienelactone hydrolase